MKRITKKYIPVDTSGTTLSTRTYLDFIKKKTVNYKLGDGYVFSTMHIPAVDALVEMDSFTERFKLLQDAPKHGYNKTQYLWLYFSIVGDLYRVSKYFYPWWKRLFYKRALYRFCNEHPDNTLSLVEAVYNFWQPVKKKLAILAKGQTGSLTYGAGFTWNKYRRGTNVKILKAYPSTSL